MQVKFDKKFAKQYNKASEKIQKAFDEKLSLFIQDKYSVSLNNHKLSGDLQGCNSINITGDWRAIYREIENGEVIFFVMIGTHSQLYK